MFSDWTNSNDSQTYTQKRSSSTQKKGKNPKHVKKSALDRAHKILPPGGDEWKSEHPDEGSNEWVRGDHFLHGNWNIFQSYYFAESTGYWYDHEDNAYDDNGFLIYDNKGNYYNEKGEIAIDFNGHIYDDLGNVFDGKGKVIGGMNEKDGEYYYFESSKTFDSIHDKEEWWSGIFNIIGEENYKNIKSPFLAFLHGEKVKKRDRVTGKRATAGHFKDEKTKKHAKKMGAKTKGLKIEGSDTDDAAKKRFLERESPVIGSRTRGSYSSDDIMEDFDLSHSRGLELKKKKKKNSSSNRNSQNSTSDGNNSVLSMLNCFTMPKDIPDGLIKPHAKSNHSKKKHSKRDSKGDNKESKEKKEHKHRDHKKKETASQKTEKNVEKFENREKVIEENEEKMKNFDTAFFFDDEPGGPQFVNPLFAAGLAGKDKDAPDNGDSDGGKKKKKKEKKKRRSD